MFGIEIDRDPAAGLSARHLRRLCRLGYFAKTNKDSSRTGVCILMKVTVFSRREEFRSLVIHTWSAVCTVSERRALYRGGPLPKLSTST